MRRRMWWPAAALGAVLAATPVAGGYGVHTAIASTVAPAAATQGTFPPGLYVSDPTCAGAVADGTPSRPYCTIAAAAAVVQPGQTVYVEPGAYLNTLTISVSGTAEAPIVFQAVDAPASPFVGAGRLVVSGASHVVLRGFAWTDPGSGLSTVEIDNSTDVTVDGGAVISNDALAPALAVAGTAHDVTITRNAIEAGRGNAVAVQAGATGVVVGSNVVTASTSNTTAIQVSGSAGASVTGNTIIDFCADGISLDSGSSGAAVENNILETSRGGMTSHTACTQPTTATAISVAADSVSATVADYNLIDPVGGVPLYSWGGTAYSDLADFRTASGQGAHDIVAAPQLHQVTHAGHTAWAPVPGSPAEDSADLNARGQTQTDLFDNYRADDPETDNTGTGVGYADRGATEFVGWASLGNTGIHRISGTLRGASLSVIQNSTWTSTGLWGHVAYHPSDFPFWIITRDTTLDWTFSHGGSNCILYWQSADEWLNGAHSGYCLMLSSLYHPLPPTRVLDTRAAVGVPTRTPIAAHHWAILPISLPGAPADVAAVVLNVTVTSATAPGWLAVTQYPQPDPETSSLNFVAGQTVAGLVVVTAVAGQVVFNNGSSGTVHVVADLAGYFGGTGDGFAATSPVRVLDTRTGTGQSGVVAPLAGRGVLTLDFGGEVPSGTTAVALNLTETGATAAGYLTAYPAGSARPTASNLNFTAGSTVANQVVVAVNDGKVQIYNGSPGAASVVADLDGYFGGGATDQFLPLGPSRQLDTRLSAPLGPSGSTVLIPQKDLGCQCTPTAVIYTVTAVNATRAGYLTAYPDGTLRPLASTVNFAAHQVVPNLAIVGAGPGVRIVNGGPGTVDVVVDESGYFLAAP